MKKVISVIAILTFLLSSCASGEDVILNNLSEEILNEVIKIEEEMIDEIIELSEEFVQPPPTEPQYEEVELPPHLEDLNWLVKPGFINYSLGYCGMHDAFSDGGIFVDERTGLPTGHEHHAHGGGASRGAWIYDIELDLMGKSGSDYNGAPFILEPRSEFAELFPDDTESIKIVYSVDSAMKFEEEYVSNELPISVYTGVAVAVGNELITDIICESVWLSIPDNKFWIRQGRRTSDRIGFIDESGKYGVINRNGDVVLPFEFETVLVIDAWTAFVMFDGRWGIVAFGDYYPDFRPRGADYNYIDGDYLNEQWRVIENADGLLTITDNDGNIFGGLDFEKLTGNYGKNIDGFRGGGDDIYYMNVRDNGLFVNYVELKREWAGLISIAGNCLSGDISEAVHSAELLAEKSVDYIKSLGYEIHHEIKRFPSIHINDGWGDYTADGAFSVYITATYGVLLEAYLENDEWIIRDFTSEVWGHY
ncbi:MAG: WG repeat-containing protein [Oscillospiraceae bacterium]|nr:WG repeat-containing protein [Oscillospiraceae bacterium]